METGFRALYVDPGLNIPPVKENQFPNQAVHFLTSAVSSSTVIDGPSFYFLFLLNMFGFDHVQTRRQNLEKKKYHSTIR